MEQIRGDGMFAVKVVGESYHESSLRDVFGPVTLELKEIERGATLVLENTNPHDPNAVRVEVEGRHVGHLSRDDAVIFRKRYAPAGVDGTSFRCDAMLIGGRARNGVRIGVELDIPPLSGVYPTSPRSDAAISPRINARRRADRCINEILGLLKGMLADGVVTNDEVRALECWFFANPDALSVWPANVLAERLRRIFEDHVITDDERLALAELMRATVGEEQAVSANPVTDLPFDEPPPPLIFQDHTYVFTGEFVYGTRKECQAAVVARGGRVASSPTRSVNVLVVGCNGNTDWAHTSFGRKIEAAMRLRREGLPIAIVEERHWASHLI